MSSGDNEPNVELSLQQEIVNETRRLSEQIHTATEGSHAILTRLSVIYSTGVAVVVAGGSPLALAFVPVLATLQALFVQSKDRETQALGLWVRILERRSNYLLGSRVFAWEDLVSGRGTTHPVMTVQLAFQVLLIYGSWLVGILVVSLTELPSGVRAWSVPLRLAYLAMAGAGMLAILYAERSRLDLRDRLRNAIAADSECEFRFLCEDLLVSAPPAGPLHELAIWATARLQAIRHPAAFARRRRTKG